MHFLRMVACHFVHFYVLQEEFYSQLLNLGNLNLISYLKSYIIFSSKDCYAFLCSHLNDLDCVLVMVGYDLAPDGNYIVNINQIRLRNNFFDVHSKNKCFFMFWSNQNICNFYLLRVH